jgi:SAM-dependent methyltransferase
MYDFEYLMESEDECVRLETKTVPVVVEQQANWAGIESGMRVADLGCGSGKTTAALYRLVYPKGIVVGVDYSLERLNYATHNYAAEGIEFVCRDIRQPLEGIGTFDMVWIRFILEYFRFNAFEIVKNASQILRPGGILCLIDLDHNCLNHFGLPERLERAIAGCIRVLEEKFNFDPYIGRKLYSFLYDLGYHDVAVNVMAHNILYGALSTADAFNWKKKIEVASKKLGPLFDEYEGGSDGFIDEFNSFFSDPRRFSYTPLISVRGRKPIERERDV